MIPVLSELADKAKAVEVYCRNAKVGLPATNTAIMCWLRSARKAGGMLAGVERTRAIAGRGRSYRSGHAGTTYQKTLKTVGLGHSVAHRWQQLSLIPEKDFEAFLSKFKIEDELLSMTMLRKLLPIEPLNLPPLPPGKYRVILADPPWQYDNSGLGGSADQHYQTLSTEEICDYRVKSVSIGLKSSITRS